MTAPLSLFLTRFSAPPAPLRHVELEHAPALEPTITLAHTDLDARLEAAAQGAREEADRHHASELAALVDAHEAALGEAVAAARAEWVEAESARLAALIEMQLGTLRDLIADRTAAVLRPLLADSVRARTVQALAETIDRFLADPSEPAIRICGPEDLLAALRTARPAPGIEWVSAFQPEVSITTGATQVETRLAGALAGIVATETDHVG